MTETKKRWLIAFGYVGFIYATLGVVRAPISFLRAHGVLRLSLGLMYVVCFFLLFGTLFKQRPAPLWRYFVLCLIGGLYFLVGKWVRTPEEQIHFFQYGLVGVFYARALQLHWDSRVKVVVAALILATIAGTIDEILQGFLPSRHYDTRDIFLNAISAFLGLIAYNAVQLPTPSNRQRLN